jgi:hypothetical protein
MSRLCLLVSTQSLTGQGFAALCRLPRAKKTPAQGGRNRGIEKTVAAVSGNLVARRQLVRCSINVSGPPVNSFPRKKCQFVNWCSGREAPGE